MVAEAMEYKRSSHVEEEEEEAPEEVGVRGRGKAPEREWVDWEDLILEDTVPLVGFVRMILHSGKYATSPLHAFCSDD